MSLAPLFFFSHRYFVFGCVFDCLVFGKLNRVFVKNIGGSLTMKLAQLEVSFATALAGQSLGTL